MHRLLEAFLWAFGAGMLCGILISIPLGPVALAVINQALRRGFRAGFLLGFGSVFGDAIYATLMLIGHSAILGHEVVAHGLQILAVAVMAGMGVRYLLFKPEKLEASAAKAEQVEERVTERWHHHPQAFLLGFVMAASNLMLAVLWATLGAFLFAHEYVLPHPISRAGCLLGILTGGTLWAFLLASFVARAHRRVSPRTLTLLVRVCGLVFLIMTLLLAWKLFHGGSHFPSQALEKLGES